MSYTLNLELLRMQVITPTEEDGKYLLMLLILQAETNLLINEFMHLGQTLAEMTRDSEDGPAPEKMGPMIHRMRVVQKMLAGCAFKYVEMTRDRAFGPDAAKAAAELMERIKAAAPSDTPPSTDTPQ